VRALSGGRKVGWDQIGCEKAYLGNKLAAATGFSDRRTASQRWPCMKQNSGVMKENGLSSGLQLENETGKS
jgi:hypothetical protein